jgi:hypothetical protein
MQGVRPNTNSPDRLSIRPRGRKGNTENWGICKNRYTLAKCLIDTPP